MTLGERIAYYRGKLGLSQGELALRHTRWQKYTPLALGWTVVLGLHGWLAPLWQVLGGAEAANWYYPVVSGLINLLAAAVVLLTVRAIYRARREKKSA